MRIPPMPPELKHKFCLAVYNDGCLMIKQDRNQVVLNQEQIAELSQFVQQHCQPCQKQEI